MTFTIENLGPIKQADITLGDLTFVCGKNGTGKTYATYVLYGFLKNWQRYTNNLFSTISDEQITELIEKGKIVVLIENYRDKWEDVLRRIVEQYLKEIPQFFNEKDVFFSNAKFFLHLNNLEIEVEESLYLNEGDAFCKLLFRQSSRKWKFTLIYGNTSKDVIKEMVRKNLNDMFLSVMDKYLGVTPILITSEKTGIYLFEKEITNYRHLLFQNRNVFNDRFNLVSQYAQPIHDHLGLANMHYKVVKRESFIAKEHPNFILTVEKMLGINYEYRNGQHFIMIEEDSDFKKGIPLHLAASSTKALLDLHYYIKHLAHPDDLLMIDEPEISLHPEVQLQLARVLARLVNIGIKVWVATHSDYLAKEFNHLITLSTNFKGKEAIMQQYAYQEAELLKPSAVKAYVAEKQTFTPAPVSEYGMELSSFEETLNRMNDVTDAITDALNESQYD